MAGKMKRGREMIMDWGDIGSKVVVVEGQCEIV